MAQTGIVWIVPPSVIAKAFVDHGDRMIAATLAVGQRNSAAAQSEMRKEAPWTDRTGNARSGLFSTAEMVGKTTIVITFSHGHTVEYGLYLETAHAGRYAIVAPTMQRYRGKIVADLQRLFK